MALNPRNTQTLGRFDRADGISLSEYTTSSKYVVSSSFMISFNFFIDNNLQLITVFTKNKKRPDMTNWSLYRFFLFIFGGGEYSNLIVHPFR